MARLFGRKTAAQLREFQPGTAPIETQPTPVAATGTLFAAVALVVAAVAWATFSHVDRIVTAQGRVITLAPQITVQPLETAIVRSINVQVGDIVERSQVMASLDPTFTEADVATARRALVSYTAQLGRLETELGGAPGQPFSPDDAENRMQTVLFHQRAAQVATQVAVFEAEIKQHEARIQTNDEDRASLERQVVILRELERMRQDLTAREVGTR